MSRRSTSIRFAGRSATRASGAKTLAAELFRVDGGREPAIPEQQAALIVAGDGQLAVEAGNHFRQQRAGFRAGLARLPVARPDADLAVAADAHQAPVGHELKAQYTRQGLPVHLSG